MVFCRVARKPCHRSAHTVGIVVECPLRAVGNHQLGGTGHVAAVPELGGAVAHQEGVDFHGGLGVLHIHIEVGVERLAGVNGRGYFAAERLAVVNLVDSDGGSVRLPLARHPEVVGLHMVAVAVGVGYRFACQGSPSDVVVLSARREDSMGGLVDETIFRGVPHIVQQVLRTRDDRHVGGHTCRTTRCGEGHRTTFAGDIAVCIVGIVPTVIDKCLDL